MYVYMNPLNLEYKFQHYKMNYPAHREAADPTLVLFKGRYYLFASMNGGFWHSEDLFSWQFHENRQLQIHLYAPDVRQVGDYLYFSASRRSKPCTILRSKDPLSDDFEPVSTPFAFWDPHTFSDNDGRVYFYWGCSNRQPIYGVEMDPDTMLPLGEKQGLFGNRLGECGWERIAGLKTPAGTPLSKLVDRIIGNAPFIEGAFVNKYKGKYYLQYAAPGTEVFSYGDGVYISEHPLGPYTVQRHNPFSTKPGGFITGAGHGSTIQDKYGNWWHASTMRISKNANFERRIGLFPSGFDEDGILFCNQNFADYPLHIPEGRFDPQNVQPRWMLLSYRKTATASSSKPGHEPQLGVDEDVRSWWCAASAAPGQWYRVDLGRAYDVYAVQLNFADEDVPKKKVPKAQMAGEVFQTRYIDLDTPLHTRYLLEGSLDGENWFVLADKREAQTNLCHDFICLEDKAKARYIKVTGAEFPYGAVMAVSGLRVFGLGSGPKPAAVTVEALRIGGMDALLRWPKEDSATGYNVRYGIAPTKLYSSWMVYGRCELELSFLDAAQPEYYVCVDAFNENGVTEGQAVKMAGA